MGYAPCAPDLTLPGDRRRFVHYARAREINFEVARPGDQFDVVVLSARADIASWADTPTKTRIVYDLIDSYLSLPVASPKNLLRGMAKFAIGEISRPVLSYRTAIERMCRRADAIICSTLEQREDLLTLNPNVHLVLDFHSEIDGVVKTEFSIGEVLHLVWEGLPVTLGPFRELTPVLQEFSRERPLALHLITDLHSSRYLDRVVPQSTERVVRNFYNPVYLYQWNLHMLPRIVTGCDIGVIPLDLSDPFSTGKPENKLLLFWRMGIPTIASASPAHTRAMEEAGVALACPDPESWLDALRRLASREDERRRASRLGRAHVLEKWNEATLLQRWDRVMESLR